jgi:hypothetical protein
LTHSRFSLAGPLRPSIWTILLSLTATLVWQPTPQNGHSESTTLSNCWMARVLAASSISVFS